MDLKTYKIDEKGLISILSRGHIYSLDTIIKELVKNNPDKKIMLWQKYDNYAECNRLKLHFGDDLKELVDKYNEFDVLVIDNLTEKANTKENIDFINYITTDEKFKDKTFIIFFSPINCEREDEISLSKFDVYKDLIETKSSEVLCFNSISSLDSMVMDKDGKVVSVIKHERVK